MRKDENIISMALGWLSFFIAIFILIFVLLAAPDATAKFLSAAALFFLMAGAYFAHRGRSLRHKEEFAERAVEISSAYIALIQADPPGLLDIRDENELPYKKDEIILSMLFLYENASCAEEREFIMMTTISIANFQKGVGRRICCIPKNFKRENLGEKFRVDLLPDFLKSMEMAKKYESVVELQRNRIMSAMISIENRKMP